MTQGGGGAISFVLVCLSVGLGTYLFRYLPTRMRGGARLGGPLGAFLGSVGVAAVAALLAASVAPYLVEAGEAPLKTVPAVAGLAGTVLAFRWRRDVAVSTLAGAVVFGLLWWLT